MSNGQWSFDASQFAPRQGGEGHPVGTFPFVITDTKLVPTSKNNGYMFVVEFTSPSGSIVNRYNIYHENAKTVEIAHGQLSALCHAVGVIRLEGQGEAIRGAKGQMKIDYQKGEEPTAEKPTGGYVEIKKVYDVNGNEPGKAPKAAPQPQRDPVQSDTAQPWGNGAAQPPQHQQPPQGQQPWPGPNPGQQGVQPNGTGFQSSQNPQQGNSWQPGPSQAPTGGPPWSK